MFPLVDLSIMILLLLPRVVMNPLFWLVIYLVQRQYQRINNLEKKMFGTGFSSVKGQVGRSLIYGLLCGIAGSYILTFVGVSLSGAAVHWVWPVAIFLMLINPRFMCFAYAGGLVSISSLLFGFPQVEIPQLMALVAVLHIIESILIWFTGHRDPSPVILKKPDGELVGGFNLQKFWPIPVVVMWSLLMDDPGQISELLVMPQWWPVLQPQTIAGPGQELVFSMLPVVAALGYSDLALTCHPREKAKKSAVFLAIYSTVLLLVAIAASFYEQLLFVAALLAPLGHELVVYFGGRRELTGVPIFIPPAEGMMVLTTAPGSGAHGLGLKNGEIILRLGEFTINSNRELMLAAEEREYPQEMLTIIREGEKWQYKTYPQVAAKDVAGIISVPAGDGSYVELKGQGVLLRWLRKLVPPRKGDGN
jgi:hypothetical protein